MHDTKRHPTRRQFVLQGGTLLGAGLATVAQAGATAPAPIPSDTATLALLAQLHRSLLAALEQERLDEAIDLFGEDALLQLGSLQLQGRVDIAQGLARLRSTEAGYHRAYRQGPDQQQDVVQVDADGKGATARFHVDAECCTPLAEDCTAAQMARLQGQVAEHRWERGRFDARFRREARGWCIAALAYHPLQS